MAMFEMLYSSYAGLQPEGLSKRLRWVDTQTIPIVLGIVKLGTTHNLLPLWFTQNSILWIVSELLIYLEYLFICLDKVESEFQRNIIMAREKLGISNFDGSINMGYSHKNLPGVRFHHAITSENEAEKDYPYVKSENIAKKEKSLRGRVSQNQVIIDLHERRGWINIWYNQKYSHGKRGKFDPHLDDYGKHTD